MLCPRFKSSSLLIFGLISQYAFSQDTDITRHQVYGHRDGMAMYYDVEKPIESNGLGIVLVVSGGFVSGEDVLTTNKPFWSVLLENGFTLFQIYHPAHPKYRIPDAFEALKTGIAHIQENSHKFGVNSERLGIFGTSTGGHLALLLAMSVEPDMRSVDDFKAVVAMMPIVDIRDTLPDEELFGARFLDFDPQLIPMVSPVDYVSSDDPPTLLIHGTRDRAVNYQKNSLRMRSLLDAARVENRLLPVDADHEIFPQPLLGEAHQAILEWFNQHL
tara:strand:- start:507 stop:1325 length:819 start_codon:yes stop_codon:yes gene_type:complete